MPSWGLATLSNWHRTIFRPLFLWACFVSVWNASSFSLFRLPRQAYAFVLKVTSNGAFSAKASFFLPSPHCGPLHPHLPTSLLVLLTSDCHDVTCLSLLTSWELFESQGDPYLIHLHNITPNRAWHLKDIQSMFDRLNSLSTWLTFLLESFSCLAFYSHLRSIHRFPSEARGNHTLILFIYLMALPLGSGGAGWHRALDYFSQRVGGILRGALG